MRRDEQCGCRAAGGEAAAVDVAEGEAAASRVGSPVAQDGVGQSLEPARVCRAGFAGRGMAFARLTERNTLASAFDPRRSLGSRS